VWSIIQAAGWPIWPLIFASVIALALIFERLWSLRQSVVAPSGMVDKVLAEYKRTGLTPELLSKTAHQGPLGRVLFAPRNIGYHIVHHLHPQVALDALPRLRAWYVKEHGESYPAPYGSPRVAPGT
jgi:biopolymer transport protein ExbB/TolQ